MQHVIEYPKHKARRRSPPSFIMPENKRLMSNASAWMRYLKIKPDIGATQVNLLIHS